MSLSLIDPLGTPVSTLEPGETLVVGRSAECGLVLADPTVSRRHAEVTATEGMLTVRDLGSRNGTFRNGVKIELARLRAGDIVSFGRAALRVQRADASAVLDEPPQARPTPIAPHAVIAPGGTAVADKPATAEPEAELPIVAERGSSSPQELTAQRLALLLEAARSLGARTDARAVLDQVVASAFSTLAADRAAVAMVEDGGTLAPAVARDRWGADLVAGRTVTEAWRVPRAIAHAAVERRVAVLSVDAAVDPRFGSQSVLKQRVRSAMCAPLLSADGTPLGVLYVDSADPSHAFDEADLDFLAAFAGIAGAALETARLGERLRGEAIARESFARYLPPPVAERIARAGELPRPGGERRTVAVLFGDLRGFTKLSASLTPDLLADLLSEYFGAMVECVFRHGGTLDKFIGDAVMAQWGAPESGPDDADRALRAALDMLDALATLNARWREQGRPTIEMGVGISTGDVFAGNIGSERRLEFTVIGDAVNEASRLCDAAGPGEILLSDSLRRALHDVPPGLRALPTPYLPGTPAAPDVYALTRD